LEEKVSMLCLTDLNNLNSEVPQRKLKTSVNCSSPQTKRPVEITYKASAFTIDNESKNHSTLILLSSNTKHSQGSNVMKKFDN